MEDSKEDVGEDYCGLYLIENVQGDAAVCCPIRQPERSTQAPSDEEQSFGSAFVKATRFGVLTVAEQDGLYPVEASFARYWLFHVQKSPNQVVIRERRQFGMVFLPAATKNSSPSTL